MDISRRSSSGEAVADDVDLDAAKTDVDGGVKMT
jgi:hypothetical protein